MADDEKTLTLVLKARNLANREVGKLHDGLDRIGSKAKAAGSGLLTMGKWAALGFAGVAAGLALAAPKLIDMAASVEAIQKKVSTVFGKTAPEVRKWADATAERMGLTSLKAQGLAANFGDLLVPMGFTRREAQKMSTDVVGLSGALSEWSGGQRSAEEVADILSKAMLGERDALKGLGISITEDDVKQRLLRDGHEKLTGAALAQAKAIATQQLIFEKSKDAQAAYAKGGGSLLARQNALKAKFDTLVETLATRLVPIFATVLEWVANKLVPAVAKFIGKVEAWVKDNKPLIDQLARFAGTVLKNVIAAIGKVIDVISELVGNITKNKPVMDGLRKGADLIAKAFGFVADTIGFVIDRVADLIDWIVKAIDWIGKLNLVTSHSTAEHVAHQTGQPLPPGAASGGWVGLHGPEIRTVGESGPEYVVPNHALGQMGGGNVIILNVDGKEVARAVTPAVSRQMYYELRRANTTSARV